MNIINVDTVEDLILDFRFDELRKSYVSSHFSWGEIFTETTDEEIKEVLKYQKIYLTNAVIQALLMEQVRTYCGDKSIVVHCWYRSVDHNSRVKGAKDSQHLFAKATDFHVVGFESVQANLTIQKALDDTKFMQTCGLEFTGGPWTHVDSRGVKARFNK